MSEVVLIHPPPHGEVPFRHIGLAYLRAALEAADIECCLLDLSAAEGEGGTDHYDESILHLSGNVGDMTDGLEPRLLMEVLHPERFDSPSALSRAIVERVDARFEEVAARGDVFLFTVNIITYYWAAGMAHRLRTAGKRTAVGGPSTHFGPTRDLLLRCGAFDAVAEGEGEGVVAALVRGLRAGRLEGVAGVAYLDGDQVRANPLGPLPDIEAMPAPRFDAGEVRDFIPILSSRGCPARCSYCSEPFNWQQHRRRAPELVVAEMDRAFARWGVSNFHFHDDMINGHLPWFDEFLELVTARKAGYRWESFCGPRGLDDDRLERMRASGCVLLKMGVQSFSPDTLTLMRRKADTAPIKRTIIAAERGGISMHYDMLTCFPGESEEDHAHNLKMIEEIFQETGKVYFSLNPFYLAIGSDTHLRPKRYGLTVRHFDPDTLPSPLDEQVRASGLHPVGYDCGFEPGTIKRRIEELGEILKRHDRDYLYLGQSEVPEGSKAFQDGPTRDAGDGGAVETRYVELLAPWQMDEVRGGWRLSAITRPGGGEDGLVRYAFAPHGREGGEVRVRLAARNDDRPCYVRTASYNLFYDGDDDGDRGSQKGLLDVVVKLVRRNERRSGEPRERPGDQP